MSDEVDAHLGGGVDEISSVGGAATGSAGRVPAGIAKMRALPGRIAPYSCNDHQCPGREDPLHEPSGYDQSSCGAREGPSIEGVRGARPMRGNSHRTGEGPSLLSTMPTVRVASTAGQKFVSGS